jgi:hypothetical protein
MMAVSADGQVSETEVKAQQLYCIQDVIDNLHHSDFCYPFKSAVTDFANHVYFDIEKDMSDDNIANIWKVSAVSLNAKLLDYYSGSAEVS